MDKRLKFTVKDGQVHIEAFGIEDASCEDIIRVFQEELGVVIDSHEKEQEYVELDTLTLYGD